MEYNDRLYDNLGRQLTAVCLEALSALHLHFLQTAEGCGDERIACVDKADTAMYELLAILEEPEPEGDKDADA